MTGLRVDSCLVPASGPGRSRQAWPASPSMSSGSRAGSAIIQESIQHSWNVGWRLSRLIRRSAASKHWACCAAHIGSSADLPPGWAAARRLGRRRRQVSNRSRVNKRRPQIIVCCQAVAGKRADPLLSSASGYLARVPRGPVFGVTLGYASRGCGSTGGPVVVPSASRCPGGWSSLSPIRIRATFHWPQARSRPSWPWW